MRAYAPTDFESSQTHTDAQGEAVSDSCRKVSEQKIGNASSLIGSSSGWHVDGTGRAAALCLCRLTGRPLYTILGPLFQFHMLGEVVPSAYYHYSCMTLIV